MKNGKTMEIFTNRFKCSLHIWDSHPKRIAVHTICVESGMRRSLSVMPLKENTNAYNLGYVGLIETSEFLYLGIRRASAIPWHRIQGKSHVALATDMTNQGLLMPPAISTTEIHKYQQVNVFRIPTYWFPKRNNVARMELLRELVFHSKFSSYVFIYLLSSLLPIQGQ